MSKKKFSKGLIIGIATTVLIMGLAFCGLMFVLVYGFGSTKTKDIAQYEKMFDSLYGMRTGFMVFPEYLPKNATVDGYSFQYRDTLDYANTEAFLQCTYDEETFENEIERLEAVYKNYSGIIKTLDQDEEGKYPYKAYIASDNYRKFYEYALITGDNQITYIMTGCKNAQNVSIDKKYLPSDYPSFIDDLVSGFVSNTEDGYSIYCCGEDEDFSRRTEYKLPKYHSLTVGKYNVWVYTALENDGRELINNIVVYSDAEGYEELSLTEEFDKAMYFKGLTCSKERDRIIITYMNEDGDLEEYECEVLGNE